MISKFRKEPVSISYSGWKRYNECPQKHFLIMTGQRPKNADCRNFMVGSIVHNLAEDYFKGKIDCLDDLPLYIQPLWDSYLTKNFVIWKNDKDQSDLREKADLWTRRLVQMIKDHRYDRSKVEAEKKISHTFDFGDVQVRLNGFIDLIVPRKGGGSIVLDFKMSQNKAIGDPYQLIFYSLLLEPDVESDTFVSDVGFLLPALYGEHKNAIKLYTVSKSDRQWLFSDIKRQAREIKNDVVFRPKPDTADCFWCEVSSLCPAKGGGNITERGRVSL